MKRITNAAALLAILWISVSLSACDKNLNTDAGEGTLMALNASPGYPPVNITVDGSPLYSSALGFTNYTPYKTLKAGAHNLVVKDAIQDTIKLQGTLNLIGDISQSFLIFGTPDAINAMVVTDNFPTNIAGKAVIRFFNFSPGSPVMDFGVMKSGNFTSIYSARSFENYNSALQYSNFGAIDTGSYTFSVRINGTGVNLYTANEMKLQQGKAYTIYASGINNNTTYPLNLQVVTHN